MAGEAEKPSLLVFGGCGFIGRNVVEYFLEKDLVKYVRVVDKTLPQVAWFNSQHSKAFDDPRVEFKSANLINAGSCESAFEGAHFDFVINCAGETKSGQTEPVYKEGIVKVSQNCATFSARHNVKRYIEISTGEMCSSEKVRQSEACKTEPWTNVGKCKLVVEESLKSIPGLKYTILRPATVYGLGDKGGIVPRIVIGGVYRHLGESMKLLWDKNLVMNTVHVRDVARALWHLLQRDDASGEIYNIVDDNRTTQGSLSELISEIFNINHDYWGNTLSAICKTDMTGVVEEVNDKHLGPWAEVCMKEGILNTPLSPYIHQELLYNKHLNLDNSKIKGTGFELTIPALTKESVLEMLEDFCKMGIFPRSLLL